MMTNRPSGRRAPRAWPAFCLALLLCACVVDDQQTHARQEVSQTALAAQPRHAIYDCGEDGTITVENRRSSVRLVDAQGDSYELPAAPPTQTSRYGEGLVALVVEEREALWMKAGREPMTCRR